MGMQTRIAIPVHFWVSPHDGEQLSRDDAKRAAHACAYHHLVLADGAERTIPFAQLEIDGIGLCEVGLLGDEEESDMPEQEYSEEMERHLREG